MKKIEIIALILSPVIFYLVTRVVTPWQTRSCKDLKKINGDRKKVKAWLRSNTDVAYTIMVISLVITVMIVSLFIILI